jgi:hypothetical protein
MLSSSDTDKLISVMDNVAILIEQGASLLKYQML